MPAKLAKQRRATPPVTKICSKCGQTKMLSDFYSNRDWVEQLGKDVWCKACVGQCASKDELREYFWTNNREWDERLWEKAAKKSELELNAKPTFQKTTGDLRTSILDRNTCKHVLKSMQINYKFVDNSQSESITYQEAKENGEIIVEKDPNVKVFSEFFNGYFKPDELKYLEDYYAGLDRDFDLSDTNLQDIAKKLAKASLQADKVQDRYMAGQAQLVDVKDAMTLFDLLAKSGNFAACKRKPGDKSGLNNWAETTMYCETNGHPCIKPIEWPKDIVDITTEQLAYIVKSLREDG